jgi:hypothetical protein
VSRAASEVYRMKYRSVFTLGAVTISHNRTVSRLSTVLLYRHAAHTTVNFLQTAGRSGVRVPARIKDITVLKNVWTCTGNH